MNTTEESTSHSLDLGEVSERLLIFGGPYSNYQALSSLKKHADQLGFKPAQVICTGDIVAYCAQPQECIDLIRDWGIHVVQGNCEHSLGHDLDDCGCGFSEDSACDLASREWFSYSRTRVSEDAKNWMRALPTSITFTLNERRVNVIHGGVYEQNQFVFLSTPEHEKRHQLEQSQSEIIIGGHCGLPFGQHLPLPDEQSDSGRSYAWLNAGVIGMPANEGSTATWFMTLETESVGTTAHWHRLDYPANEARDYMQQAHLAPTYQRALVEGLWPSLDILPEMERKQQGKTITLPPMQL